MAGNNISRRRTLKTIGAGGLMVGLAGCLGDDDDGEDLPRQIEFVIPFGEGGGFDAYVRALAPILQDELEEYGVEEIRPSNRDGGGGRVAMNYMMDSPADGSVIGLWQHPAQTLIGQGVLGEEDYNVADLSHFGVVAITRYGTAVAADHPAQTYDELIEMGQDEPVSVAAGGARSGSHIASVMQGENHGFDVEYVLGYAGAAESVQATIRGDVDFVTSTLTSVDELMIEPGEGTPLVAHAPEPHPAWPDTPTPQDLGYEPVHETVSDFRPVSAPPGMDEDMLATFREAFDAAVNSDEYAEWSEDAGRPIEPGDHEEVEQTVSAGTDELAEVSHLFEDVD